MVTKKKMDNLYNYLTDPWTLVSFVVFVFGLWAMWSKLNWKIEALEKKTEEIDITKIETKLAEIQADIARMRNILQTQMKKQ